MLREWDVVGLHEDEDHVIDDNDDVSAAFKHAISLIGAGVILIVVLFASKP